MRDKWEEELEAWCGSRLALRRMFEGGVEELEDVLKLVLLVVMIQNSFDFLEE